jgi:hypothetical protein
MLGQVLPDLIPTQVQPPATIAHGTSGNVTVTVTNQGDGEGKEMVMSYKQLKFASKTSHRTSPWITVVITFNDWPFGGPVPDLRLFPSIVPSSSRGPPAFVPFLWDGILLSLSSGVFPISLFRPTAALHSSSFGLNARTWLQNRVLHFFLPSARIEKH